MFWEFTGNHARTLAFKAAHHPRGLGAAWGPCYAGSPHSGGRAHTLAFIAALASSLDLDKSILADGGGTFLDATLNVSQLQGREGGNVMIK